jgi:CRP-like cAMP-binding protein/RsiW-degrading membrane proteinase PrsW (M82 family)
LATETVELLRASSPFGALAPEDLASIAARMWAQTFEPGVAIIREGEVGTTWYLLRSGTAAVVRSDLIGQEVTLAVFERGQDFGEMALVSDQPRSATVRAVTSVEALVLDQQQFRQVVQDHPAVAAALRERVDLLGLHTFLKRASPFARFSDADLWSVVRQLQSERFGPGEVIVREGDLGDRFYLVRSGRVGVLRKGKQVAQLQPGDYFGELALLAAERRTATVQALEGTEVLALSRPAFEAVLRAHSELRGHFREVVQIRFRAAPGQPLLLPDPLTTVMPFLTPARRKQYWLVLVIGTLLFAGLTVAASQSGVPAALLAALAVGSFIGPLVFVMYLAESKLLAERPIALGITFLMAAGIGLPLAVAIQRGTGLVAGSLLSAFLVALCEEAAKLSGMLWLVRRRAIRFQMDGVIFGAAAGMGFAAFESVLYGAARLDTIGALVATLWLRALLSPFTHGTWTALAGAAILRERSRGWAAAAPRLLLALAVPVALHTLWDWRFFPALLTLPWLILIGVVSVLLLRGVVQRAVREESDSALALNPELATEQPVGEGLICGNCGQVSLAGAHYCPRCGYALRVAERAPA